MAVTVRGERAQDRERDGNSDEVRYRRVFVVETDDADIGPREVSFHEDLPILGAAHPESAQCRVINRRAQPMSGDGRRLWSVELTYSNKHDDPENPEDPEEADLEFESPEVEFGFENRRIACPGTAKPMSMSQGAGFLAAGIVNSAGEPFDPPPEKDDGLPFLRITRNEIVLNTLQLMLFENSLNADAIFGAAPLTLKMTGIGARRVYKKGFRYWRVSYTMTYNRDTWELQLLDHGRYYRDAANGNSITSFVTDDDPPQPRIGLLDGNGDRLNDADDPVFLSFPIYQRMPYVLLNLGAILA